MAGNSANAWTAAGAGGDLGMPNAVPDQATLRLLIPTQAIQPTSRRFGKEEEEHEIAYRRFVEWIVRRQFTLEPVRGYGRFLALGVGNC